MRWYPIFLVEVVYLLVYFISVSIATVSNQNKVLPANSISSINESPNGRVLRNDISTNEVRDPVKDIDDKDSDGTNSLKHDDWVDKMNASHSDMRAGGIIIPEVDPLKVVNSLSHTIPKVTKSFAEEMAPIMMKLKLHVWAENGKSATFVQKELGLNELWGAAFTGAANFKYYDDYVVSQLPIWAKKGLTLDEVIAQLDLRGLPADIFKASPDFKYYDQFVSAQALEWSKKDLPVDDVLLKLGMNTIPEVARTKAVNFKYYEEFVISKMKVWVAKNVPVSDVMANLKLDQLTGNALLSDLNYPFYKSYVNTKLRSWATDGVPPEEVLVKLGLRNLRGRTLTTHPNYVFFDKYLRKGATYQEEGWLKQSRSTYDIWNMLQVYRVHPTKRKTSTVYEVYKHYVNLMDDYIVELGELGFPIPNMISKEASRIELQEKTFIWTSSKRPGWYVKYSLGLEGLGDEALKKSANYEFYEYYLKGLKHTSEA
ncbi:RxLR effector protein [Phytophthora megakarya]|uniref:RxLR effector protein n=1 Tax=Phytophthora megakarya TaxID=4795 RepID=A0A225VQ22_9STRA|nr:RxLR effector protein [Phytophthora megakarya]